MEASGLIPLLDRLLKARDQFLRAQIRRKFAAASHLRGKDGSGCLKISPWWCYEKYPFGRSRQAICNVIVG